MSNQMLKDMSAIKSDLECIEEEKKVEQSYEAKKSRTDPVRASVNQRYRKSLVFGDQTSINDKIECIAIDEIDNISPYKNQNHLNCPEIGQDIDDKVCEEFNEIIKRK